MKLSDVTPLLLTFNEEANLDRTLGALAWASRIVLVDSGSTDGTLDIAQRHSAVDVLERPFDNFAAQRNFGLDAVETPWTLSLDADHRVGETLATELEGLEPGDRQAFTARFQFYVWGQPVRCAILPPRPVLLMTRCCRYEVDGHAEKLLVPGAVGTLDARIAHDDRKPLSRWVGSQDRYARQEADKLAGGQRLSVADRIRRHPWLAPLTVFFHVLLLKGGILEGRRGWFYAYQRLLAELNLALHQLDDQGQKALRDEGHGG
ncbi:MAG: glycosyltransferase family 2 protein [Pseudomonadota bacterium]